MHLLTNDNLHLPDLAFFNYCAEKYNINRGVYNAIDSMLYARGVRHILKRRRTLLLFLQFINQSNQKLTSPINFGHGGVAIKINEYFLGKVNVDEKEFIY